MGTMTLEERSAVLRANAEFMRNTAPALAALLSDTADAIDAAISARGEAVGMLCVNADESNQYGKNAKFHYSETCMDLPVGEHPLYTAPPALQENK